MRMEKPPELFSHQHFTFLYPEVAMASRGRRRAFTLVEMLVVISIVVILMGILLPVLGAARGKARTRQCAQNLQQMSAGVIAFENAKARFPGSREMIATRGAGIGANKWATWNIMVLPYLDQQPIFDLWDDPNVSIFQVPASGAPPFVEDLMPSLPIYRCPSDITLEESDPNLDNIPPDNSYVANGGLLPRPGVDPAPYNTPAAYIRAMNRNTGVFHDLIRNPRARFLYDMLYDGAGNTIMLTENLQARWYVFNGDVNQFGSPSPHLNRLSTMFYFLYTSAPQLSAGQTAPTTAPIEEMQINGLRRTVPLRPTTARPSSEHKGGVNMAFCDRSVKFVKQSIDYHVYVALMTPRDRKADIPWREFVLKSGDYLSE